MLDVSFLGEVDARKGRWRDTAAEAKGIATSYYWTGKGRDALEVAYGTAVTKPNATAVREVWKQRHGRAAAPLLVVVAYPKVESQRTVVCGSAGESPPVVELDHAHAERLAAAALDEPSRHLAIRFLTDALEGDPDEKGLLEASLETLGGLKAGGREARELVSRSWLYSTSVQCIALMLPVSLPLCNNTASDIWR